MASKTFVLDTNVLLHDPEAIQKFEGNDVVMPLVVLEELDKMKRFSDELGKNARQVIPFVDEIKGDIFKGIKLENGATFSIFVEDKSIKKEGFPNKMLIFALIKNKLSKVDIIIQIFQCV